MIATCLILFGLSTPNFAQSPPLTPAELRETATNLAELKAARENIRAKEEVLRLMKEVLERENALRAKGEELHQKEIANLERQIQNEKSRGDQLDSLLKERNRKPGFWCKLGRVFLIRCG